MPPLDHMIHVYRELAEREAERGATQIRDRFLLLAADAALTSGHPEEAEQLRKQLVAANPHHLIRPYESFAEAMKAPEVYSYVADLRGSYAPEEAEQMLQSLRDGEPCDDAAEKPLRPAPTNGPAADGPEIYPLVPFRLEKKPAKPRVTTLPAEAPPVEVSPYHPQPERPRTTEEPPSALNVWVPTGLFILVLAASLALAAYTLARPFVRF